MNLESAMFLGVGLFIGFAIGVIIMSLIFIGKDPKRKEKGEFKEGNDEQSQINKLQSLLGEMQLEVANKKLESDSANQMIRSLNQQLKANNQTSITENQKMLEDAKRTINQLNTSLIETKKQLQIAEQSAKEKEKLLKSLSTMESESDDVAQLQCTLAIVQADLDKSHAMSSNFADRIKDLEEQLKLKEDELLKFKLNQGGSTSELDEVKQKLVDVESKYQAAQSTIAQLNQVQLESNSIKSQSHYQQPQNDSSANSSMLEDAKQVIAKLDNALNVIKVQLADANRNNKILEKELNEKQSDYEKAQKQLHQTISELQNKQIQLETQSQNLIQLETNIKLSQQTISRFELELQDARYNLEKQTAQIEISEKKRRETLEQMNKMIQIFYKQNLTDLDTSIDPKSVNRSDF